MKIDGIGPNLKKSGNTFVGVFGEDLKKGYKVVIETGGNRWTGEIFKDPKVTSTGKHKAVAKVSFAGPITRSDEDFEAITVTVTNTAPTPPVTATGTDDAVVDAPE
jgi:hypothetical protein